MRETEQNSKQVVYVAQPFLSLVRGIEQEGYPSLCLLVQVELLLLGLGLETEEQERRVEDKGASDGQDGVHEKVKLHVLESVLLEPL